MHRILSMLLAVLGLGLIAPADAHAQPYPPEVPVVVDTPTIPPGGTVTVSAQGFIPGEEVTVVVTDENGQVARNVTTVTADAAGAISVPVTIHQTGTAVITATGLVSGTTGSTTVQVAHPVVAPTEGGEAGGGGGAGGAAVGEPGFGMPPTGNNGRILLWQLLLAAGAIGLGAVLLVATTRRRKQRETE